MVSTDQLASLQWLAEPKFVYIRFELVPLFNTCISANRTNIDHSVSEFNEGTTLLGQLQVRKVSEDEVHQLLVFLLADPLNEAGAGKRLAQTKSHQTILREAEIEKGGHVRRPRSKLLLLLGKVGSADLQWVRLDVEIQ